MSKEIKEKEEFDISKATKQYSQIFTEKNLGTIGMGKLIEQLKYAILTREHVFLEGAPGTAKSMLAKRVFSCFSGAKIFEINMGSGTGDDELFGATDVKKYREESKTERRTENSIVECDFAFLDEMFDAEDSTLRSLLSVLNERVWRNGNQVVQSTLHSVIGTANYTKVNERTKAYIDRFLFKGKTNRLRSINDVNAMLSAYLESGTSGEFKPKFTMEFSDMKKLSDIVRSSSISFDADSKSIFSTLSLDFISETKKEISDRVIAQSTKVAKANALLDSRMEVNEKDFTPIKNVFCTIGDPTEPREAKIFDASYGKAITLKVLRADIEEVIKVANSLSSVSMEKYSISELLKAAQGIKAYVAKIDSLQNSSSGKLPKNISGKLEESKKALAIRLADVQSVIKKLRESSVETESAEKAKKQEEVDSAK